MAIPSCPRCGGTIIKRSGFSTCKKCEYVLGSQVHDIDWNRYDAGRLRPAKSADEQNLRVRRYEPKRRTPLKGDET